MSEQTAAHRVIEVDEKQRARLELHRVALKSRRRKVERPVFLSLFCGVSVLGVTTYNTLTLWPIREQVSSLLLIMSFLIGVGLVAWAALLWFRPDVPTTPELRFEVVEGTPAGTVAAVKLDTVDRPSGYVYVDAKSGKHIDEVPLPTIDAYRDAGVWTETTEQR